MRRRVALLSISPIASVALPSDNGFSPRYEALVSALDRHADLLVVEALEGKVYGETVDTPPEIVTTTRPVPPNSIPSRVNLVVKRLFPSVAGHAMSDPWQQEVRAVLDSWQPDVVFGIAHSGLDIWAEVCRHYPTVIFAEELLVHPHPTVAGRALRRVEEWAQRRTQPPPAAVVVISPNEVEWAADLYPHAPIKLIPHTIDMSYWRRRTRQNQDVGAEVFFLGRLDRPRNIDGLLAVAEAVAYVGHPTTVSITAAGIAPSPSLLDEMTRLNIHYAGAPEDARPFYERATIALVPQFASGGAKTTILQAWAMGVPVVTTTAAAGSLGVVDGEALRAGDTAEELAHLLLDLRSDRQRRAELIAGGQARLRNHHSTESFERQILDLVGPADPTAEAR